MNTFSELCVKHNCDKGLLSGGVGHGYCKHYGEVLERMRTHQIRLLEIGVGDCKSIRVWLDYFTHPNTEIYGVDIGACQLLSDKRYHFIHGDQSDHGFLHSLCARNLWYDVIVDDGSHMSNGIIPTFEAMWPFVKSGGLYIIEDLRTSYLPGYQVSGWPPPMEFVKRLLDDVNAQTDYKPSPDCVFTYPQGADGGRGIEWFRFTPELLVLKKQ